MACCRTVWGIQQRPVLVAVLGIPGMKHHRVWLTEGERAALGRPMASGRFSARELMRARSLLKADQGPDSARADAETAAWVELFGQAQAARYELRAGQVMWWGVPEARGHDDLINAPVLCVQAGLLEGRRAAVGWRG